MAYKQIKKTRKSFGNLMNSLSVIDEGSRRIKICGRTRNSQFFVTKDRILAYQWRRQDLEKKGGVQLQVRCRPQKKRKVFSYWKPNFGQDCLFFHSKKVENQNNISGRILSGGGKLFHQFIVWSIFNVSSDKEEGQFQIYELICIIVNMGWV